MNNVSIILILQYVVIFCSVGGFHRFKRETDTLVNCDFDQEEGILKELYERKSKQVLGICHKMSQN